MWSRYISACSALPLLLAFAAFAHAQTLPAAATTDITLTAMNNIFAFGDSYTANGYNPAAGLTRNLTRLGATSANGYNWLQYLALRNPSTVDSYFDFAAFGATVNGSVIKDNNVTVASFVDQVATFRKYFVPAPSAVQWQGNDTLFALWFGINDIGFSLTNDVDFAEIQPAIGASYNSMIAALYAAGARNFLMLGVPPTDRSPLIIDLGDDAVETVSTNIGLYNVMLANFASVFASVYPGASLVLFDTQPVFNTILDNPLEYGFTDVNGTCDEYVNIDLDPLVNLPVCPWPFDQYFWKNGYHPSWRVHELLADLIAKRLTPNTTPANLTSIPQSTASVTSPQTASHTSTSTTLTSKSTNSNSASSTRTATLITSQSSTRRDLSSVNSVVAGRPTGSVAPPPPPISAGSVGSGRGGLGGWCGLCGMLVGVLVLL